jgi:hypothetical protein
LTTISSKRQAADIFDQHRRDLRDRVAAFGLADLAHLRVDVEHEGVEMDALLPLDLQLIVEQIHQHRLAAPDRAPQIHAAGRRWLAARNPPQQAAARRRRFKFGLKLVQPVGGGTLFGIGFEFARCDERVVGGKDGCHFLLALRIVPAKLRTICSSPAPCTTRPRRKIRRAGLAHQLDNRIHRFADPAGADELRRQVERHRMPGVERPELMRGGEQRDIDQRERYGAMDIVAEIAVLCVPAASGRGRAGGHPQSAARRVPKAAR